VTLKHKKTKSLKISLKYAVEYENGDMGREIESRRGIYRMVALIK
jgi:hypothetical protein